MSDKPRGRFRATSAGQVLQVFDGYGNVIAGMGQGRDKVSQGFYTQKVYSEQELVAAYETAFLPRRIIDALAEDATRRWRNWNANKDQLTKIEKEEQRVGILKGVELGMKNGRLLGGAALYFPIRGQRPETPLNINAVGKGDLRRVILFGQHELIRGELEDDLDNENFGRPKFYILQTEGSSRQIKIHHTRIIPFFGNDRPVGFVPFQEVQWSRSVLQTVLDATKVVDGSVAAISNLVLEARIDVINIQGLMQKLASNPSYERELIKRFSMAVMSKSVNGTLVLDEKEQYQQKSQTYGSLPELLDRFFQYVSGSCGIPVTRLFGTSPGGMNATGEADIRHYYDRVQTLQNNTLSPSLADFDEVLIRSSLGRRPKNIFYTWRSLWQVTEKERSEIGLNLSKTGETMIKNGMIDPYSMGLAVVTSLAENESMPGIEDAWDMFQTVRSKPTEPVDLNKQNNPAGGNLKAANDPSAPRSSKTGTEDKRPPRPLYVSRKVLNGAEIINWAKSQGLKDLFPASDLHVTITYSRDAVDWMEMDDGWSDTGELLIDAGGARDVDIFGDDTLVILFNSNRLKWRHEEMREKGASFDWEKFQPHISITQNTDGLNLENIKPYTGKIELGPEIFEEIETDA